MAQRDPSEGVPLLVLLEIRALVRTCRCRGCHHREDRDSGWAVETVPRIPGRRTKAGLESLSPFHIQDSITHGL